MDTSPSKRRKLSPTTSTAINASNHHSRPIGNPILPRTPRQALSLSPTKASLARYNPSLLPRPKSAGEGAQRPDDTSSVAYKQHEEKTGRSSHGLNPIALRSTTPTSSPIKLAARIRASRTPPYGNGSSSDGRVFDAPRRRSRTPGRVLSPTEVLPMSSAPIIPASPPRPEQEVEEEAQNTASEQLALKLQANAARSAKNDQTRRPQNRIYGLSEDGEPELPPTPTQLGLEVAPEPPKGLLYSSPSRRSRRNGSSTKSSPLKHQDPPLTTKTNDRLDQAPVFSDDATEAEGRYLGTLQDAEIIAKKKTLDQLLLQYKGLQNDVIQLEREAGQTAMPNQEEVDELVSIITSSDPTHQRTSMSEKKISISSRIAQFMPFSKPSVQRKDPTSISTSPIPSHRPLQLEDPLPYLRVFTPLTVHSINSLVPSSDTSQPWLQRHDIILTSPQNLLRVKIQLSVNAVDESVSSLVLNSVSPWAQPELGDWFNKQASTGDLPTIGWACGRYWEVALLRARCWKRCHQRFRNLIPSALEFHRSAKNFDINITDSKRKGIQAVSGEGHGNESETTEALQSSLLASDFDIRSQLGQQSILFSAIGISLLITWCITLDWTGEPESHISACASFPKTWQIVDERASLENIGEVFDRLLLDRGVFEAVTVIVALLFERN